MNELWILILVVLTPTEDAVFRLEGHDTISQCFEHREMLLDSISMDMEYPERSRVEAYCVKNPEKNTISP